jgi:beta-lactam-binding protein with PASTA domain
MKFLKFITSKIFIKNLGISIVIALAMLFTVLLWLKVFTHHGKAKPVPDFYGLTPQEAVDLGKDEKLRIEISDSVYNTNAERGTIVEQYPRVGKKVKKNRKVFLIINATNPESVEMPGVVGLTHRQAKAILETYGLEVGKLSYIPDLAKNNVLKQKFNGIEIHEGDTIPKGSSIDLVLGTGLSDRKTIVPDLIGSTYEQARNSILNASLNMGAALYDETVFNMEDSLLAFIWKQNPEFDEENPIQLGSPVYLWLTVDSTRLPQPDTLDINPE